MCFAIQPLHRPVDRKAARQLTKLEGVRRGNLGRRASQSFLILGAQTCQGRVLAQQDAWGNTLPRTQQVRLRGIVTSEMKKLKRMTIDPVSGACWKQLVLRDVPETDGGFRFRNLAFDSLRQTEIGIDSLVFAPESVRFLQVARPICEKRFCACANSDPG